MRMTHNFCSVSDIEAELEVGYNYFDYETTPTRDMIESWISGESDYIRAISRFSLSTEEETLVLDHEFSGPLVYCKNGYLASVSKLEVNVGDAFNPDWVELSDYFISNHSEGVIRLREVVFAGDRKLRITGVFRKTNLVPIAKMLCIYRVASRALKSVASGQLFESPADDVRIGMVTVKFRPERISQYIRFYDESISRLEARLDDNGLNSILV